MAFHQIQRIRVDRTQIPSGGVVRIECDVVDSNGAAVTPGTTKQVRIYNPDGDEVASSPFTMTADSTGKLSYNYTTLTTLRAGWYHLLVQTNDGTHPQEEPLAYAFETTG